MRTAMLFISSLIIMSYGCSSSKKARGSSGTTGTATYGSGTGKTYTHSQAALKDDNTFILAQVSDDETYGYTGKNPVMVGGVKTSEGPKNERRFLNALAGPNGEEITYTRTGSCCPFDSPNGFMGGGLLDRYEVRYKGLEKPVYIFINMYDFGVLKAPKGFTIAK
jgi:hypothetical protein